MSSLRTPGISVGPSRGPNPTNDTATCSDWRSQYVWPQSTAPPASNKYQEPAPQIPHSFASRLLRRVYTTPLPEWPLAAVGLVCAPPAPTRQSTPPAKSKKTRLAVWISFEVSALEDENSPRHNRARVQCGVQGVIRNKCEGDGLIMRHRRNYIQRTEIG